MTVPPPTPPPDQPREDYVLAVQNLTKVFPGQRPLYQCVNLVVPADEILVIVGESGIGKSVFLSLLVGLIEPTEGEVWYRASKDDGGPVIDIPIHELAEQDMARIRTEVGIVFQESSLFDWMTVYENIELPLEKHPEVVEHWIEGFRARPKELCAHLTAAAQHLPPRLAALASTCSIDERATSTALEECLSLSRREFAAELIDACVLGRMSEVRLDVVSDRNKLPSELSGGMKTRVGIARTLALRPRVLLYDEPTAGLDPIMAKGVANAILDLQVQKVVRTSIVVTHDKELYWTLRAGTRTRLIYLHRGRFLDAEARPVNDILAHRAHLRRNPPPPPAREESGGERREPGRFLSEFTMQSWYEAARK